MTECEYPTCKNTELNEDGLCEKHVPGYLNAPGYKSGKRFDIKHIQDKLKEMSKKAPKRIAETQLEADVQEAML